MSQLKNMWRNVKPAARRGWRYRAREANDCRAAHRRDMRIKPCCGSAINDWSDLGLRIARIANQKLACRPADHREKFVCNLFLDTKEPQRRAPLSRRTECRGKNVVADLLWQRRRIGDHRVDPAGFGDQHWNWPVLCR